MPRRMPIHTGAVPLALSDALTTVAKMHGLPCRESISLLRHDGVLLDLVPRNTRTEPNTLIDSHVPTGLLDEGPCRPLCDDIIAQGLGRGAWAFMGSSYRRRCGRGEMSTRVS